MYKLQSLLKQLEFRASLCELVSYLMVSVGTLVAIVIGLAAGSWWVFGGIVFLSIGLCVAVDRLFGGR